jgi:hypothetical protein
MKITIDTVAMTISIAEDITLKELMTTLNDIFPNNTWEEYKLLQHIPQFLPSYPVYPTYPSFPVFPYEPYSPTSPLGPFFTTTVGKGS